MARRLKQAMPKAHRRWKTTKAGVAHVDSTLTNIYKGGSSMKSNVDSHLKEMLKDPYFREQHELKMQQLELIKPIIAYRIKHDLNQKQLAEKIGISQQHISNIESGNFSNLATLQQVLRFIGYTIQLKIIKLSGASAPTRLLTKD